MRIVILALATLLLAGCWESQNLLLDPQQAVYPFPAGTYYDESNTSTNVSIMGNGWYNVNEDTVLVNRLGTNVNGLPSYAYAGRSSSGGAYVYGVLFVENGGNVVYKVQPDCDSASDQRIFQQTGNYIEHGQDGETACFFSSRESAFAALRMLSQERSYTYITKYTRR